MRHRNSLLIALNWASVALLAFSVGTVVADEIPTGGQAGDPLECTLSGQVEGPGHRITIPAGLVGCYGWHRVYMVPIVDLSQDRFILVSYSKASISALDGMVESLSVGGQRSEIAEISRDSIAVNGLPGERAVYQYLDSRNSETILEIALLTSTLPSDILDGEPLFQLTLSLATSPDHYSEDRRVFQLMISSIEQDINAR